MKFFFVLFLFFHIALYAYDDSFQAYQFQYTKEEIAFKMKHFLQKSKEIEDYYSLTDEAFYLFANREDKLNKQPEFTLRLSSTPQKHPQPSLPYSLKNLRIAIDPGHVGGDFAILEQRYIKMANTKPAEAKQMILFKEGTLALMTALLLKQWLEEEGALVLLTKEKDGQAVYDRLFFEWLATEGYKYATPSIKGLQIQPTFTQLFSNYYNRLDLQARAQKINAFHPHLTLIIHYNAHGGRDPITQENFPENYNYNMVFIGGSFCKGELAALDNRKEFLRLLLTDDLEQSLHFSEYVIRQLTEQLNVPPVQPQDPVPYLTSVSMQLGNGIYARNLFLTRMVHGPLCYGESLCQDHREECIRLNGREIEVNQIRGPKRVEQVAKAYFMAVKEFIRSSQKADLKHIHLIGK
jgi:N-acetylmuramoyl-L-alanine amidase